MLGVVVLALPAPCLAQGAPAYIGQALLIGLQDYKGFPSLSPFVAHDIQLVREALLDVGYDPEAVVALTNVKSLSGFDWVDYDDHINQNAILGAMNVLKSREQAYPVTLVYVSGHGGASKVDLARNFAVWDSKIGDGSTYLPINEVAKKLHELELRGSRKLIVVDACSNDALTGGDNHPLLESWGVNELFSSRLTQSSEFDRDTVVDLQVESPEPITEEFALRNTIAGPRTRGVSLFTRSFVQALRQANARDLTLDELFSGVEDSMSEHWLRHQTERSTIKCEETDVDGKSSAGPFSDVKAPKQCPYKQFFGSRFAVARRRSGPCEGLRKNPDESDAGFLARQLTCAKGTRVEP